MESTGEPSKIHATKDVLARLIAQNRGHEIRVEERQGIQVKGVGLMSTVFISIKQPIVYNNTETETEENSQDVGVINLPHFIVSQN